jgi:ABC-type dipeptide/oligopeptide/nickel transport system permease component
MKTARMLLYALLRMALSFVFILITCFVLTIWAGNKRAAIASGTNNVLVSDSLVKQRLQMEGLLLPATFVSILPLAVLHNLPASNSWEWWVPCFRFNPENRFKNWLLGNAKQGERSGALQLNFGKSVVSGQAVNHLLPKAWHVSFQLGFFSFLILFFSFPILLISYLRSQNGLYIDISFHIALLFSCIPAFVLASLGQLLLANRAILQVFPIGGLPTENTFATLALHFGLPSLLLTIEMLAYFSLIGISVIRQHAHTFLITALKARGLHNNQISFVHLLRLSVPVLVYHCILLLPTLFLGHPILEYAFSLPGLGSLAVSASMAKDYSIVLLTMISNSYLT